MNADNNCVVEIEYTLTGDDGEVIDTSEGRGPLAYLHGHNNIIPGLENALAGKAVGDSVKVSIPPIDGYGEHDADLIRAVPRGEFPDPDKIEVGMQFQASSDQGPIVVTVTDMDAENITVDGNHELAGHTLHFDVNVVGVREATAEELDHGHVHGPGGHHH